MNFERYTDRAKGFVQAAQNLALREGHQQFAPEHLLKVLLDDPEGMAAGRSILATLMVLAWLAGFGFGVVRDVRRRTRPVS